MNFDIAGPFPLTRHGNKKLIDEQSVIDLRSRLEDRESGLSKSIGCYVFAIHAGRGYTPYYVGQSCKRSLLLEALNASNRGKYNHACSESNGRPVLFLLPKRTPSGKFKKKGRASATINFLERWLIARALEKNIHLINNKETRFLRKISVPGFFNAGKGQPSKSARELRRVFQK